MLRQTRKVPLPAPAPGTQRHLLVHSYGPADARPKAYLQAALHADEIPGMLVQHHLLRRLDAAAAAGEIRGRIVLVPYANPIGLDQWVNSAHLGRYELAGGGNFNRGWPDLAGLVAERLEGALGEDAAANVVTIRAAMIAALDEQQAASALAAWRLLLMREAVDADFVLDLHCDDEALMHLFLIPAHWPEAADLAAEVGCRSVLLAADSGGGPFDESFSTAWTRLAERFPDKPIPPACLAGTIEYRGRAEVSDALAEADAEALFRFLQRRGLIAGDPGPLPESLCEATRLDACDTLRTPSQGVLSYRVPLGAQVRKGEVVADLIDPAAEDPTTARREIRSANDGLVISRRSHKFVTPGMVIAKIAGTEPLPHRRDGALVED
ncbi:MAG: M14 family metallopeptidase [Kiloniellales bacterium]|nr:M14 family metallopeptidase [Kiloniellales bacterium]